ncbi:hypothetical protein RHSIM_Rhsim10G0073000 [Rhododendron simsii]|uniref:Uncharacterized protein n=1 Tax=Rhododendron simsii TaxID=118357 RepID=A0A834LD02_RHOSS|nr:hypothetical protein RHSIM_Rhsim10G0073000 [Rhododendron simsii]
MVRHSHSQARSSFVLSGSDLTLRLPPISIVLIFWNNDLFYRDVKFYGLTSDMFDRQFHLTSLQDSCTQFSSFEDEDSSTSTIMPNANEYASKVGIGVGIECNEKVIEVVEEEESTTQLLRHIDKFTRPTSIGFEINASTDSFKANDKWIRFLTVRSARWRNWRIAVNSRLNQERNDAVYARDEAKQALAIMELERYMARVSFEDAESQFVEYEGRILNYEERIDLLRAALNKARNSASSSSTVANLEDSSCQITSERDVLTQELIHFHEDWETLKAASGLTVRQLHEAIQDERQQANKDRGYYVRGIDQLRTKLAFASALYLDGRLDASKVEFLLSRLQYLRDMEVARILSVEVLFERYRDALVHFQEVLDSLRSGGGHPFKAYLH